MANTKNDDNKQGYVEDDLSDDALVRQHVALEVEMSDVTDNLKAGGHFSGVRNETMQHFL